MPSACTEQHALELHPVLAEGSWRKICFWLPSLTIALNSVLGTNTSQSAVAFPRDMSAAASCGNPAVSQLGRLTRWSRNVKIITKPEPTTHSTVQLPQRSAISNP